MYNIFVAGVLRFYPRCVLFPQIKAAMFMCLQRDPGVRVSSLNLWKFMAASGDSSVAQ